MSQRSPILLATRSLGKLHELRPIFQEAGLDVMDLEEAGLREEPAEERLERFETFEENALAKARHFFERSGGRPTVADDSGLEVFALGGRPGVRTKRFSGRTDLSGRALDAANNATLLAAMAGCADRRARYVCVAAYVDDAGERTTRGASRGTVLEAPRGSGGFGYDPLFESREPGAVGLTFAEIDRVAKQDVSHRGRAFHALFAQLASGAVDPRRGSG